MEDGCHVLIVDDEQDFRDSLGLLLRAHGYRVSEAQTGNAAVSLLEGGLQPDVVLLDQRMPGLSGVETLARIRQRGSPAPVLLVSAVRDVHDLAEAHGFAGAIAKPFSPDELLEQIRAAVHRVRADETVP